MRGVIVSGFAVDNIGDRSYRIRSTQGDMPMLLYSSAIVLYLFAFGGACTVETSTLSY